MVLTRRRGALVLVATALLGGLALAGCNQSLFDNHGAPRDGGGGGDDGGGGDATPVPTTCPDNCLGDAAADFPGPFPPWRYVEDKRARSWAQMTADATGFKGVLDPGNHITRCTPGSSAAACTKLPGALLVSSSGTSAADPAIEFTAPDNQVIQLSVRAYLPSGADQKIWLYRNSREDVLFTGTAKAEMLFEHAIVLDALKGDRFLVAIEHSTAGATDLGLHFYINATGATFPSTCQVALRFDTASGAATTDACQGAVTTHYTYVSSTSSTPTSLSLMPGPFPELGNAADITAGGYLARGNNQKLDWSHDITVQFWVQARNLSSLASDSWLYDDFDADFCGGVKISVRQFTGDVPHLSLTSCSDPNPPVLDATMSVPYPVSGWEFVRVVRTSQQIDLCLDGVHMLTFPTRLPVPPTAPIDSSNPFDMGRALYPSPEGAFFDGRIDDVRAFAGTLPCP